jgi:hypothetical protein
MASKHFKNIMKEAMRQEIALECIYQMKFARLKMIGQHKNVFNLSKNLKKRILSLFKAKDFTTDLTYRTLEPSRAPL